jgi:hypothetical protein
MSTITKPGLSERFEIEEGLRDFRERVVAERPLSDEDLTDLLGEIGHETVQGPEGGRYVLFENGSYVEVTTREDIEVPEVHEHEDCEVCRGSTGYRIADVTGITYFSQFRRDVRGRPVVEAQFIRDDEGDWMFVPGSVHPHATALGAVAERLVNQQ